MEQVAASASASARHRLSASSTTSNTNDAQTSAPQTDGDTVVNTESVVQLTPMNEHLTATIRRRLSAISSTDDVENHDQPREEFASSSGAAEEALPSSRRQSLTDAIRRRLSQSLQRDEGEYYNQNANPFITNDTLAMMRRTNNHTGRRSSQNTISIDHDFPNLLYGLNYDQGDIFVAPQPLRPSTTELSRPPSYQRYQHRGSGDREREREWQTLSELRELYRRRRQAESEADRWLHILLWRDDDAGNRWAEAVRGCFLDQFLGFYRIFWFVIFIFIGAMSIFIPSLPPSALALWAPFLIYVTIALIIHYRRRRREKRITELEQQITQMREQRIRDVLSAMELPQDHYLVTEITNKHRHPVTTLLPPPPAYPHGAFMRSNGQSDVDQHDDQRREMQRIRAETIVDEPRREGQRQ